MTDPWSWPIALVPQVIGATVLLLAGLLLTRWVERVLTRLFDQHRLLDLTFRGVLTTLVRYSILLLAVIAALQQLGIQTTSVLAGIGAIFVAIALALQGTLSNLAAGVLLLWLRPFRVASHCRRAHALGFLHKC
jgi:small conductance mechanosensitive channel